MSMIWMFDVRRAVMPHDDNTKRKSVSGYAPRAHWEVDAYDQHVSGWLPQKWVILHSEMC